MCGTITFERGPSQGKCVFPFPKSWHIQFTFYFYHCTISQGRTRKIQIMILNLSYCVFLSVEICAILLFFFFYQSCSCHLTHIYIYIYICICSSQLMLTSIFNGAGCTTMVHPNHYSHTQMKDANSSCPIPIFFIKKKLPPNDRTNIHINNNKL